MNIVPKSVTRLASRSLLKLNANSPTILVVAGVVGLGATSVMAAKASRKTDPIIESYQKDQIEIRHTLYSDKRAKQKDIIRLYSRTSLDLGRIYGPTIIVGTVSAASILYGHKILKGRHIATMAAYSGLFQEFQTYRRRVAEVIGDDKERDLYEGARLEYEEDPNHKGEYKLKSKFDELPGPGSYLRPWFDESNANFTQDPVYNYSFLKGVQQHMNNTLEIRGHVFLNDVFDALGMSRRREGAVEGWVRVDKGGKDGYIDFGFMTSQDPHSIAFRNQLEKTVQLNFNTDGIVWDLI